MCCNHGVVNSYIWKYFCDSFAEAVQVQTGRTKEVLHPTTLTNLWLESSDGRQRVIDYVAGDVARCMELVRQTAALIGYVEMARVTGLNISV